MGKQIDFTGLNKLAYQGFEEYPEERDSLLEAGYTVVDEPVPFEAQASAPKQPSASAPPLSDPSGSRDYKRLYRMAFDFHQRHNPPTVDREYWRVRIPGVDDTPEAELRYWEEAAKDLSETASAGKGDPFLQALLVAVYEELERQYKALRDDP